MTEVRMKLVSRDLVAMVTSDIFTHFFQLVRTLSIMRVVNGHEFESQLK